MTTQSQAVTQPPLDSQGNPPAVISLTRLLYWSVRRELWENRSIYVAPLAVAAVYLAGFLISLFWVPRSMRELTADHMTVPDPVALVMPYSHAAMLLMLIGFLVGIFYCLDALHSERRDRSILFWKSMPVSDFTTILAKASIPLVLLPAVVFATTVALQVIMRLLAIAVLLISRAGAATQGARLPLLDLQLVLLYALIVLVLWHAPIYMWMLLVSGWARRAAFLWAVLPPLAIAGVETIALHTSHFGLLLQDRLWGFAARAFDLKDKSGAPVDPHFIPLAQLAPGRFLSSPSVWVGLVVAAALFAAAVRLRRDREPI